MQDFPIVGIGASAGGLDAFKRLIKAIPEDSGMAYVLVQHLDRTHESMLPEILSRVTNIPVNEITDEIHLAPDNIYVIPENKALTSFDGKLMLTPREKILPNLAINVFFKSLAEVHETLAVGVVLSGTASDGTLGLQAIKEHGGLTFAQDLESAAYGDMPRNAINAGVVDFVLPPENIPEKLLQVMQIYQNSHGTEEHFQKNDEAVFRKIILILSQHSGVDFTYYKQTTIRRRIARRMAINKTAKLNEYLRLLNNDKAEGDALFNDMLIPVTSFFRDPKTFQAITDKVFPALLKHPAPGDTEKPNDPIRIWVAGCSTGEEAYSFAILLREFLGDQSGRQIQIFATDISSASILKARSGIYHKAELEKVPAPLLKKYFQIHLDGYQVNKQIREMCVFAVHNFLKDPPFAKMDLVSCRNVLIYMDTFLQKKALTTFHYALKDMGFLLLGKSETTGNASELFITFAKEDKIYSRNLVPGNFMHFATERKRLSDQRDTTPGQVAAKTSRPQIQQPDFRKSAEAILLLHYTPASVVVNEQMDVVDIHGNIAPYLEAPQGKPSFNLLKMAREGLAFELRNTLHKAKTTQALAIKEGVPVKSNGDSWLVNIEILPLADTLEPHFLVLFHRTLAPDSPVKGKKGKSALAAETADHSENMKRIGQLEIELSQTREDMRSITEDQEAVNEELQSANEELLSSSEEMQSLNEEMETSKEELQSTNEELTIVNQELLDKHEQITASRLYTEAIIATVREPLVVLDKSLRIKSINNSFFLKFNSTEEETTGKLIYEIKDGLFDNAKLRSLLEKVLPQRSELKDYEIVIQLPLPAVGKSAMLINARQMVNEASKEKLILLAIEDFTERKSLEDGKKKLSKELNIAHNDLLEKQALVNATRQYAEAIIATVREPFVVLDKALRIKSINTAFFNKFNITDQEAKSQLIYEVGDHLFDNSNFRQLLENVLPKRKEIHDYELVIDLPSGESTLLVNARHVINEKNKEKLVLLALKDITDIKMAEQTKKAFFENLEIKVKERTIDLEQANLQLGQFAHATSHELQEPLRKIMTFAKLIQQKQKENKPEEVKLYIEKIEMASSRMRTLIKDILNYASVTHHDKLFEKTDLNEILKNIISDFDLLISEKHATITSDQLPDIEAIPFQMGQLFYDIISNSLKFSKRDVPPVIHISAHQLSRVEILSHKNLNENLRYYELVFKDNGIGFNQKYEMQIFSMFQRLNSDGNYPGTGIGLALCKKLVLNYRGEIFAEGVENEGTSIHVILPVHQFANKKVF